VFFSDYTFQLIIHKTTISLPSAYFIRFWKPDLLFTVT